MASIPTPAEIKEQEMHITDDMAPNIIAASAVCFAIACVAVALRFRARRLAMIKYEADDWLIVVGLVRRALLSFALRFGPDLHLSESSLETCPLTDCPCSSSF